MDDLISRQAAIDAVSNMLRRKFGIGGDLAEITLAQLPSVTPKRKTGKWIEVDDAYNRIRGRCSACGWEAHMYEDDVVGMWFCPNCGADMRGEEDD